MQTVLNKLGLKFECKSIFCNSVYRNKPHKVALSKLLAFRPSKRFVPATLAVLIQCAALLTVTLTIYVVMSLNAFFSLSLPISIFGLVLMQAVIAAAFSYLTNMASWWRWIHLCFPIAAWVMFQWDIPNAVYLVGFLTSLSLFWTTFRTQVPFFPSRPMVWHKVASIIPQDQSLRLIDIGSGLGDMSMYMAKIRPESHIEGIEIAPLPWLISYFRGKFRRSTAKFILGNYQALDFSKYDVIFAYLSPAAMSLLWNKASKEMRSGTVLISLEFDIPDVPESLCIPSNESTPEIYVWQMP